MNFWKGMSKVEKGLFGVGVVIVLGIVFLLLPDKAEEVVIIPTPIVHVEVIPTLTPIPTITPIEPTALPPVSYPIEGSENVMVAVGDIMVEVDVYGNPVHPELLTPEQMFPFVPAR